MKWAKYSILFIAAFILLVWIEYISPKPLDWIPYMEKEVKSPYGCKIFFDYLEDISGKEVSINNQSIYNYFKHKSSNFERELMVFITRDFELTDLDMEKLDKFVKGGNHVFISALNFSQKIKDSLNFETELHYNFSDIIRKDTAMFHFVNYPSTFLFDKSGNTYYFSNYDTVNTVPLGYFGNHYFNYLQVKRGSGSYFVHLFPMAFTNYHFKRVDGIQYAVSSFSVFDNIKNVIWDEYYKPYNRKKTTPLKFVLSETSLQYAYYIGIFGVFVHMVFGGRRKQRVVPVIKPPQNSSYEFVKTLSGLFLKTRNNRNIISKRFSFLTETLKNKYFIKNISFSEDEIAFVADKTGVPEKNVRELYQAYWIYINSKSISQYNFLQINHCIEEFYNKIY